ncbi:hypothetical protein Mal33_10080 [Rosistilla oblonga]|uniref:Uncharacterized protein n=1 Tax=Rosistilla oblonga TaxID=2527990 RepID=A0A518IPP6_9BACT|nr:hypothetical protein Mal33_10080 [Rosistilla oblonga]
MAEEKLRGGFECWGTWGWCGGWAVSGAPAAQSPVASNGELLASPLPLRFRAIGRTPTQLTRAGPTNRKKCESFC